MDKSNFHIKQRVQGAEMRGAFDDVETAKRLVKKDAFTGNGFLMSAVTVAETSPASQSVDVGPVIGWDKLGQRVAKAGTVAFAFANAAPVFSLISRLYIKYLRLETNPRPNPAGGPNINYDLNDSFVIQRDDGVAAAVPVAPALRTDESLHLADVTVPGGGGNILNAAITTTVQLRNSDFPIRRIKSMSQGMDDAMVASVAASPAPSTTNRVALISDLIGALPGLLGQIKIVTTGVLAVDVERADVIDGTAVKFLRVRNKALALTGGAPAAGDKDYAGAVSNAWHYIYAIGDSTNVTPTNVIASLNSGPGFGGLGPTLPVGFNVFRLIGAMLVQAAAVLPFRQINGETIFDDVSLSTAFPLGPDPHVGVGPTAFLALSLAPYCPPEAERVALGIRISRAGAANVGYTLRSLGGPAIAGRTIDFYDGSSGAAAEGSDWEFRLHVDTSQQVSWNRALGAVCDVNVVVRGFVMDLHFDV